jgi:hypothetical protein
MTSATKRTANRQTHWNLGNPRGISLEEFLAEQEAAGFSLLKGKSRG